MYTLTVADNGIGLPEGLDWRQVPSLGLALVPMLDQHQFRGRIDVDHMAGTVFTLGFHAPPEQGRLDQGSVRSLADST